MSGNRKTRRKYRRHPFKRFNSAFLCHWGSTAPFFGVNRSTEEVLLSGYDVNVEGAVLTVEVLEAGLKRIQEMSDWWDANPLGSRNNPIIIHPNEVPLWRSMGYRVVGE